MYKLHHAEVTYNSDSYEIAIEAHSDSNKSVLSACCFPMDHLHIGLIKYKKSCSKSTLYKTVFLHDNSREVLRDDMNPNPNHMTILESRMDLLRVLPPACFLMGLRHRQSPQNRDCSLGIYQVPYLQKSC